MDRRARVNQRALDVSCVAQLAKTHFPFFAV
jgi:hypothetical protein